MIVNDIRDGKKTILILGIDCATAALGELLREYGNSVSFLCPDSSVLAHHRSKGIIVETIRDIDNYQLELIDYIIFSQSVFLDDSVNTNVLKKIEQVSSRVFLAMEIMKYLFPENKFVAIFGKSYKKIICSALSCIFNISQINIVELPTLLAIGKTKDDTSNNGLNLQGNNIFVLDLAEDEMNYLKDFSFDVIALLSLEKEEQIPTIRNFLTKQNKNSVIMVNTDNTMFRDYRESFGLTDNSYTKIIPISVEKMVENGYSYINGTIYNYHDSNLSYDLTNNGFVASDLNRLSVLSSFVAADVFNLDSLTTIASLETFRGLTHNMEYVRHDKNITFVDNSGANTLELIETPFRMHDNIFAIFIVSDRTGGDLVRLKNHRDNIRLSLLIDIFDVVDNHREEFGSVRVEKIDSIGNALNRIMGFVVEESVEDEITVILSPIFSDKMNDIYYSGYCDEFKKLIESL
jgi:UDP-N-acetylmuramoylalanine-D-glutamate ligase